MANSMGGAGSATDRACRNDAARATCAKENCRARSIRRARGRPSERNEARETREGSRDCSSRNRYLFELFLRPVSGDGRDYIRSRPRDGVLRRGGGVRGDNMMFPAEMEGSSMPRSSGSANARWLALFARTFKFSDRGLALFEPHTPAGAILPRPTVCRSGFAVEQ